MSAASSSRQSEIRNIQLVIPDKIVRDGRVKKSVTFGEKRRISRIKITIDTGAPKNGWVNKALSFSPKEEMPVQSSEGEVDKSAALSRPTI